MRLKLDQLTRLWTEPVRRVADGDAVAVEARKEWRLALEGFGRPEDFADASVLLGKAKIWESQTPFLAAGHLKTGGYPAEIRRLISRRGLPEPDDVTFLRPKQSTLSDDSREFEEVGVEIRGRLRRAVHFHRFRSRKGEEQPDALGTFLRLTFPEKIAGPLAFGYGSHFGLGMFRPSVRE